MKRYIFNAIGNYCGAREFQKNEPFDYGHWFSLSEKELTQDNYQNGIQRIKNMYVKDKSGKKANPFYSFSINGELLGIYLGRKYFGNNGDVGGRVHATLNGEHDICGGQVLIRMKDYNPELLAYRLENARYYLQEFSQTTKPLVSVGEDGVKIYSCKAAVLNDGMKTPTIYDCLNGKNKTYLGKFWYHYDTYMKGEFYSYDKYSRIQK